MNLFPQLNQWFHIAYTFDEASHVQALYVNAALVASSFVNKTVAYDSHAVLIGADITNGSPGLFYQGEIDELSLYNRALTGTEVVGIYSAAGGGKCPSANPFLLGDLASGTAKTLTLGAVPTNCAPASASATASATTTDPNLLNNTASTSPTTVQDVPANQLRLTAQRVSVNNNSVEICWPLTCAPYMLQATGDLNSPIIWSPAIVPVSMINGRYCTVLSGGIQYFRLKSP